MCQPPGEAGFSTNPARPLDQREALYNFLSTFSGTHYVTPRALTATVGLHF
jgi:hypothetical protein